MPFILLVFVSAEFARAQFSSIESLLIERHVMHICDHASIVGLRTYFETKHFMFFVMELIHGGNTIDKVVAAVGRVPENMYEFMIGLFAAAFFFPLCVRHTLP
jgi:serine/threonine protein kinase